MYLSVLDCIEGLQLDLQSGRLQIKAVYVMNLLACVICAYILAIPQNCVSSECQKLDTLVTGTVQKLEETVFTTRPLNLSKERPSLSHLH